MGKKLERIDLVSPAFSASALPLERVSVAPSLPLTQSLAELIAEAKAEIQVCLGLRGKQQRLSATKLEAQLRVIGGAVEARAMHLRGWASVGDFRIMVEGELFKARATFTNDKIIHLEEVTKETGEYLRDMDTKYPPYYPGRMWSKNIRKQYELFAGLNRDCPKEIERIRKNLSAGDAGISDIPLQLREAYILALSEIRPFGGTLLAEDWFDRIKEKRRKGFIPYEDGEQSAVEKVRVASRLFPSDWIAISNAVSHPLLIRALRYSTHHLEKISRSVSEAPYNSRDNAYFLFASHKKENIPKRKIRLRRFDKPSRAIIRTKGDWRVTVITFSEGFSERESTIVHELGHRLGMYIPTIHILEEAFFLRRTTNSDGKRTKLTNDEGYPRRQGGFANPQTGTDPKAILKVAIKSTIKEYSAFFKNRNRKRWIAKSWLSLKNQRRLYEVFSTGLPSVLSGQYGYLANIAYDNSPKAKTDVELRHLVLGMLATV